MVISLKNHGQDLVNPVHGSNDPAPAAGSVVSGPGQFRNYASDTRYMESDPLRHGLDVKQVQATPFAMGPKSNPSSQTSSFRTLDISKANEGRQNWTRYSVVLRQFWGCELFAFFLFSFFFRYWGRAFGPVIAFICEKSGMWNALQQNNVNTLEPSFPLKG